MPSPADQASEITRLKPQLDRARMERERAEKSDWDLRGSAEMSFEFIRDHSDHWPIRPTVPDPRRSRPAGYYAWRGRPESARASPTARCSPTRALLLPWPVTSAPGFPPRFALRARDGKPWPKNFVRPMPRHCIPQAVHHRQPSLSADRAQPAQPGVCRCLGTDLTTGSPISPTSRLCRPAWARSHAPNIRLGQGQLRTTSDDPAAGCLP